MSSTPAAHLARLKVTYQGVADHRYRRWPTAVERSTGRTITADTVTELETRLARF
jgi:hypothetical protein